MKKIELYKYTTKDPANRYIIWTKYHHVSLGNGITNFYKDKKDVHNFLAITNKYLNNSLIELNDIYINTFSLYRQSWFISRTVDVNGSLLKDTWVKNQLDFVNNTFEKIIYRTHTTNSNFFLFKWLFTICEYLRDILRYYQALYSEIKLYIFKGNIIPLQKRVDLINYELKNYGKIIDESWDGLAYNKEKRLRKKFSIIHGLNQDLEIYINEKYELILKYIKYE